jgi:hypothetical protein
MTGDEIRTMAAALGLSTTRARRAELVGIEVEAAQYAETHAAKPRRFVRRMSAADRLIGQDFNPE